MDNNIGHNQGAVSRKNKNQKFGFKKSLAGFSRWLHIYLSMLSFFIVFFFAVTGLTLNHADWFDGKEKIKKFSGSIPLKWVNVKDTVLVPKLEIVEFLRKNCHVNGAVSDFVIDDSQYTVSFKGPGYAADAFIDRKTGTYKLTETMQGFVAVLNDLHKGRDTGKKWSVLIDLAAIFMCLVSLTGIIMICFMKKKRLNGLLLVVLGSIISYLVYFFLVP